MKVRFGIDPVSYVMAGDDLVAYVIRTGSWRKTRWVPYWSIYASILGAPVQPGGYATRQEAEAAAMQWASRVFSIPPHVEKV